MKVKALLIGCLLAALGATKADAALVVLSATDITNDQNISASNVTFGSGLKIDNASGIYSAHHWTSATSIDSSDYISFTFDANTGYEIDLASFDFNAEIDKNGPKSLVIEYSVGGNTFQSVGSVIPTSTTATDYSIALNSSEFQNLTDPVEFRIYGYNAGNPGGKLSINDYSFTGSVSEAGSTGAVPEPQSLALIGVGSLLMTGYLRRVRRVADTVA
ncbi:PEP-CTERM sorting domain-containing protein [Chlorobaculum sp. 24CR]|uniref:PEP-CTERM sorting domain-containing protein n=1 Tax=Chlorobaculum sp. 24CR TaxID=2508878 RepID=UPI001431F6C7|nr:PEP-CTERM sorting domain-containing protein [Chlorobaculum sp. 24CR]